jgi:acetoin utilization deacetylase AcuC-like enzyme
MTTAIIYDPLYLEHDSPGHPESSGRLRAIVKALDSSGMWARVSKPAAQPISLDRLHRVHTPEYVRSIKRAAESGGASWHGGETFVGKRSYDAALLAAGGFTTLVEAVMRGDVNNGFALVRPPGHHASAGAGEGFCLFNNMAVAARAARDELGAQRVLIVDWDLHHGQGTQYAFEADPTVLYCSTHQWGIYPGTGHYSDVGSGAGKGFTINVPLTPGAGDQTYLAVLDELFLPAARRFKPDLVLVSAGFDTHWSDPLGSMLVTVSGYAAMTKRLVELAGEVCDGRLAFTLEGGYNHDALAHGALAVLNVLLGSEFADPLGPPRFAERPVDQAYLAQLRALHGLCAPGVREA